MHYFVIAFALKCLKRKKQICVLIELNWKLIFSSYRNFQALRDSFLNLEINLNQQSCTNFLLVTVHFNGHYNVQKEFKKLALKLIIVLNCSMDELLLSSAVTMVALIKSEKVFTIVILVQSN
jgi:hypothetical protein